MNLKERLTRIMQNAIRRSASPKSGPADTTRVAPAMGRARVPLTCMLRVRDIDGPTVPLPRPGDAGVNRGPGYAGKFMTADRNRNSSPRRRAGVAVAL